MLRDFAICHHGLHEAYCDVKQNRKGSLCFGLRVYSLLWACSEAWGCRILGVVKRLWPYVSRDGFNVEHTMVIREKYRLVPYGMKWLHSAHRSVHFHRRGLELHTFGLSSLIIAPLRPTLLPAQPFPALASAPSSRNVIPDRDNYIIINVCVRREYPSVRCPQHMVAKSILAIVECFFRAPCCVSMHVSRGCCAREG
jgi:hypothetical protein